MTYKIFCKSFCIHCSVRRARRSVNKYTNTQIQIHVHKYKNTQHKKISHQLLSAHKGKTFNSNKAHRDTNRNTPICKLTSLQITHIIHKWTNKIVKVAKQKFIQYKSTSNTKIHQIKKIHQLQKYKKTSSWLFMLRYYMQYAFKWLYCDTITTT